MKVHTFPKIAPSKLSQLDGPFCYKRYFVFIIGLVFLSLPFSERRILHYDLLISHSLSFSDMFFLISGIAMLVVSVWKGRLSIFASQLSLLWPLVLPLFLMVIFFSSDTKIAQSSISIYMILGASLYMVLLTGILLYLGNKKILSYLIFYTLVTTILLVPAYLLTRFSQWDLFMYGEATPSLHFPFDSPNQAALFCVVIGVLTVGVLLSSRKFFWLYLAVPVGILAAFQTGSRSGALFLIVSGLAFIILFLIRWIFFKISQKAETFHFLLAVLVGGLLLFLTRTAENMRGLDVFRYNLLDMLTGNVDSYRHGVWKWAFGILQDDGVRALPDDVNVVGGLHNIYLDLWVNWGVASLLAFLVFLAVLFVWTMKMLWLYRSSDLIYLYASLFFGLGVIAASLYANPLLHLKFIWAFFGLIAVMRFWSTIKN